MPQRLRALLGVLVSLGLLTLAATQTDLVAVREQVRQASWPWLGIAAALVPLQVVLSALRWRLVAGRMKLPLSGRTALAEYALSVPVNMLLPGGIAGDAVRVWRHRQNAAISTSAALRAAVLERGAGQVMLAAVALPGVALWPLAHPQISRPPGVLTAILILLLALAVIGLGLGRDARVALSSATVWGLSAVITTSFLVAMACCARAIGAPMGAAIWTIGPLILLAMSIPLSVGGWGLREASATLLLPRLGWAPEEALTLSALYGLTALLGALPGGLVALWFRGDDG